ncbi:unnamed protein product [Camellia sinensis]
MYQGREIGLNISCHFIKAEKSGSLSMNPVRSGIKLPANDSGGVVTAFYVNSELDFEFLGNRKGKPSRVQTNVFLKGKGSREQRIHIWFENTKTSKLKMISLLKSQSVRVLTYFVNRLSPQQLFCDEYLIRVFKNNRRNGVGFPTQPMQLMATIWDGYSWATNGGKTKIIWAHAPFISHFRGFAIDGCPYDSSHRKSSDDKCNDSEVVGGLEAVDKEHPEASDDSDGEMDDDAMFRMDCKIFERA